MAKPQFIELPDCEPISILFEDRSVLAIDKPRGWMLVPRSWRLTKWNLQAALDSSIRARDFWARSRNLSFLRHVHRLDADTSGVLLFAKSPGAVNPYSDLFENRKMEKTYLAVVIGRPKKAEWICRSNLAPDGGRTGKMKVDPRRGKPSETHFKIRETRGGFSLVECNPITGRTHQIRAHLADSGTPIAGDGLYGGMKSGFRLGLRAVRLAYFDPFTNRRVEIHAPPEGFLKEYGF